jgi:hypothetical protein
MKCNVMVEYITGTKVKFINHTPVRYLCITSTRAVLQEDGRIHVPADQPMESYYIDESKVTNVTELTN